MAATQLTKTTLPSGVTSRDATSLHRHHLVRPAARTTSNTISSSPLSFSAFRSRTTRRSPVSTHAAAAAVDAPAAPSEVKDYGVQVVQGKRLQVISAPVAEDTITIRCLDWDRDRFDIEFG